MDKRLVMRFWSVPPEEVPAGEAERIAWLYDWWARIDAWIEENRPAAQPAEHGLVGPPARRRLTLEAPVSRPGWCTGCPAPR